jgi:hypothetical protein
MDQVRELLDIIEAQKEKGVTGASVMFAFFKRRVQPIQQHHRLGFEYIGPADPSRMCAEELPDEAALQRVQRVLLDVDAVPYVPTLFSARNPPKPVSIRLLVVEIKLYYSIADGKTSCRDTQNCTGATRRDPISPGWTTFSPAPLLRRRGPALLRLNTAAGPQRM